jgi:hypothetical protein
MLSGRENPLWKSLLGIEAQDPDPSRLQMLSGGAATFGSSKAF